MVKLLKKNVSKSIKLEVKRPSVKKLTTKFSSRNGRSKVSSSASSVVSSNTQASSASRISLPSFRRSKRLSQKKDTSSSLVARDELIEIKEEDAVKEEKMDVLENKASEMSVSSNEEEGEEEKKKTAPTKEAVALVPGVYIDEDQGIEAILPEGYEVPADDAPATPDVEAEDEVPDVEVADDEVQEEEKAVMRSSNVSSFIESLASIESFEDAVEALASFDSEYVEPKVQDGMAYFEGEVEPKVHDTLTYVQEQIHHFEDGVLSFLEKYYGEEHVSTMDATNGKKMNTCAVSVEADGENEEMISAIEVEDRNDDPADDQVMPQEIRV